MEILPGTTNEIAFGDVVAPLPDWRDSPEDDTEDATPEEVAAVSGMLGIDLESSPDDDEEDDDGGDDMDEFTPKVVAPMVHHKSFDAEETTMNVTKAAWELDAIRNNRTDTSASLLARVDAVGAWLASQKNSVKISKLLCEASLLADKLLGGSGKRGNRISYVVKGKYPAFESNEDDESKTDKPETDESEANEPGVDEDLDPKEVEKVAEEYGRLLKQEWDKRNPEKKTERQKALDMLRARAKALGPAFQQDNDDDGLDPEQVKEAAEEFKRLLKEEWEKRKPKDAEPEQTHRQKALNFWNVKRAKPHVRHGSGAPVQPGKNKPDSQDVRGKPCPPGYNAERDGCIAGKPGEGSPGKPAAEQPQNKIGQLVGMISSLPKAVAAAAATAAKNTFTKIESKYGRGVAVAAVLAAIPGLALPIPGSSLMTMAPVIGAAVLYQYLTKKNEGGESPTLKEAAARMAQLPVKAAAAARDSAKVAHDAIMAKYGEKMAKAAVAVHCLHEIELGLHGGNTTMDAPVHAAAELWHMITGGHEGGHGKPNYAPPPEGEKIVNTKDCCHDPDPEKIDPDHGMPTEARVGLPAFSVPPPPKEIPRLPNLTEKERRAESRFADAYLEEPDGFVMKYMQEKNRVVMYEFKAEDPKAAVAAAEAAGLKVKEKDGKIAISGKDGDRMKEFLDANKFKGKPKYAIGDAPNIFNADDAKDLSSDYNPVGGTPEERLSAKGTYNAAVHQTAAAIAKRSFVKYLDDVVMNLPEDQKMVLVSSGGVASGKGFSISNVPAVKQIADRVGATWDAAGEANATENPWVLEECRKRGIRPVFTFVHADPNFTWENPERGVMERANKIGRMVDARLYADSYAIGARNFKAFMDKHKESGEAEFFIIDNSGREKDKDGKSVIKEMSDIPEEALTINSEHLYGKAVKALEARQNTLRDYVVRGGLIGGRLWGKPKDEEGFDQ